MGRPRHIPTQELRDKVLQLRAEGGTLPSIAEEIDISPATLSVYYSEELKTGKKELGDILATTLYQAAMKAGDDPKYLSALYFALKTKYNYRERSDINHMSEDGSMSPKRPVQLLPAVNEEEDPEES